MWIDLLGHVSMYGMLTMMVMAATAVTFAWLGGIWGILLGQVYVLLTVLHLDLNLIHGPLDMRFAMLCAMHVTMVNLLLLPAWVLGIMLRKMQAERQQRFADR